MPPKPVGPEAPALVPSLLQVRAAAFPDVVAVEDDAGTLSLGALYRRADALAQVLLAAGAGPERMVAVRAPRDRGLMVAVTAVILSGAAFVPVDPTHPPRRQRQVVHDSGARVLLADAPDDAADMGVLVVPLDARPAPGAVRLPMPAVHPEQLAYVIYTSGSTGEAKGVAVPHAAFVRYVDWAARRYLRGGPALVSTSPAFDLTITALFAPLLGDGSVRLMNDAGPEALATVLAERAWGLLKLTPSHLDVLSVLLAGRPAGEVRVEVLVAGGEALRRRHVLPWLGRTEVVNEYGPTEATVGCCVRRVGAGDPDPVPIGVPVPYATATVLAGDRRAGPGVRGELCVGGAGLARGYLGRPGLTADRFRPDPDADGGRRYRTGDIASRDPDGTLRYHGRADRQLRVRGHRVEPGEVEAVLRAAPGVRDAVVCGETVSDRVRLVAYLVAEPGIRVDRAALRRFLVDRLPAYSLPGRVVTLPVLPLAANGKVDHRRLVAGDVLSLLVARAASVPDAGAANRIVAD